MFEEWDQRLKSEQSANISVPMSDCEKDKTNTNTLDKNSKSTLHTILYNNMRHRKEEIPKNFELDEKTGRAKDIDIVPQITPFTSDKSILNQFCDINPTYTITTNWSKTPKSVKYKLICSFVDNQIELTEDTKCRIKNMFRRNFEKCSKLVQIDIKTKSIVINSSFLKIFACVVLRIYLTLSSPLSLLQSSGIKLRTGTNPSPIVFLYK